VATTVVLLHTAARCARTRSLSLELDRPVLQNHSVFTRFLRAIPQMNELVTLLLNFVKIF